jgi:uncharacterized protein (TIGR03084 family)
VEVIVAALRAQHAELAGLLEGLDDAGWQRPSPCEGWSVSDVVLHLAQTDDMARASARGQFGEFLAEVAGNFEGPTADVDEGAGRMVELERGASGSEVRARWQAGADELAGLLAACDPHQRVTWVAGELSARTLATTRLAETWIHTGDVAEALDRPLAPTDRLWHIARLAWRTLPYAFARAGRELTGPVAFELRGPGGDSWDFVPDGEPLTTIRGEAHELCRVAARRDDPAGTKLDGEGPDAAAVLELVRTYA